METYVVKLGGSLLFNSDGSLRRDYLEKFLEVLYDTQTEGYRLIVVVGGGATARRYITLVRETVANESALDQLGILSSRLNAALLYTMYYKTFPIVPVSVEELVRFYSSTLPVIFMGGLQPGQSTTTVAALVAEATRSQLIITTDVEGVFTADPKKDPNARLLETISVDQLMEMFSKPQRAGEYRLIDLLALQVIKRSRIKTRIIKGDPPGNIRKAIKGEKLGTLIQVP